MRGLTISGGELFLPPPLFQINISTVQLVTRAMLKLRPLRIEDEDSFRRAVDEFSCETPPWEFAFKFDPREEFAAYLEKVNSWPHGVVGFVPHSYLVAIVDGRVVGRVSIRHELNSFLSQYGGHVGYGVIPSERRKGYATEILRQALGICRNMGLDRVMISCDTDNEGSIRVIEKNGGRFDRVTDLAELEVQKRIYWIETDKESNQRLDGSESLAKTMDVVDRCAERESLPGVGGIAEQDHSPLINRAENRPELVKYYNFCFQEKEDAIDLSDEFSEVFHRIISGKAQKWRGAEGLVASPRGIFITGEKSYYFYGSFVTSGDCKWQSVILSDFWCHLNEHGDLAAASFMPYAFNNI